MGDEPLTNGLGPALGNRVFQPRQGLLEAHDRAARGQMRQLGGEDGGVDVEQLCEDAAAPFGVFSSAMRSQADQIVVTSRFRFTREDELETSLSAN